MVICTQRNQGYTLIQLAYIFIWKSLSDIKSVVLHTATIARVVMRRTIDLKAHSVKCSYKGRH